MESKGAGKRSWENAEDETAQTPKRPNTRKSHVSAEPQPQAPKPPQWNTLPLELRLTILELVYENNAHDKRRALLATVSLEWRDFFERRNYRHLKLRTERHIGGEEAKLSPDIEMLKLGAGGVSPRHVPMIRQISLEIELNTFTCLSCHDAGAISWVTNCNRSFRYALVRLFWHLSFWEYAPSTSPPTSSQKLSMRPPNLSTRSSKISTPWSEPNSGLTLVLTAHTHSDAGHWFRNYDFGHGIITDLPLDEYEQMMGGQRGYPDASSHLHGYTGFEFRIQSVIPRRGAIFRLFSPLCRTLPVALKPQSEAKSKGKGKAGDDADGEVEGQTKRKDNGGKKASDETTTADETPIYRSRVPIITSLVIPRQTRRYICKSAMVALLSCLPNLNRIVYEPWRIGRLVSRDWDPLMAHLIRLVPLTVKSLAIFEDFNEHLTSGLLASVSVSYGLDRNIALGPPERRFLLNQEYEPAKSDTHGGGNASSDAVPPASPPPNLLAEAFVDISRCLEFLSVGYMIDARHFFAFYETQVETEITTAPTLADSEPGSGDNVEDAANEEETLVLRRRRIRRRSITEKWRPEPEEKDKESRFGFIGKNPKQWPYLKRLILTSPILTDQTKSAEILTLLKDASLAARYMPRLEKLVIWYYTRGEACAFTYEVVGRVATLSWRGTWALERDEALFEAWKKAVEDPEHDVVLQPGYLRGYSMERSIIGQAVEIKSHGDAAFHLGLAHDGVLGGRRLTRLDARERLLVWLEGGESRACQRRLEALYFECKMCPPERDYTPIVN